MSRTMFTPIVRLGTTSEPSRPIERSDTRAKIAGAMKMPSECFTMGSRVKRETSLGVYWLAPNWTTTTPIDTTSPVKAIMPLASADRIVRAVSGSSFSDRRSRSPSARGTSSPSASAAAM
jgi:hypothetical protein